MSPAPPPPLPFTPPWCPGSAHGQPPASAPCLFRCCRGSCFLLSHCFSFERTPLPQPPGPEVCTMVALAEWLCFPVCGSEGNTARLQPGEARVQRQTAPSSDSPPCEVGVGVAAGIRSQYLPGRPRVHPGKGLPGPRPGRPQVCLLRSETNFF